MEDIVIISDNNNNSNNSNPAMTAKTTTTTTATSRKQVEELKAWLGNFYAQHPEPDATTADLDAVVRTLAAAFPDSPLGKKTSDTKRRAWFQRRLGNVIPVHLKPARRIVKVVPKKLELSKEEVLGTAEALVAAWLEERIARGENILEHIGRHVPWARFEELRKSGMSLETFKRRLGQVVAELPAGSLERTQALTMVEMLGGPWTNKSMRGSWDWYDNHQSSRGTKAPEPGQDEEAVDEDGPELLDVDQALEMDPMAPLLLDMVHGPSEVPYTPGRYLNDELMDLVPDF